MKINKHGWIHCENSYYLRYKLITSGRFGCYYAICGFYIKELLNERKIKIQKNKSKRKKL